MVVAEFGMLLRDRLDEVIRKEDAQWLHMVFFLEGVQYLNNEQRQIPGLTFWNNFLCEQTARMVRCKYVDLEAYF